MNLNTDFSTSTSIHPNGRNVKRYNVGTSKKRRKAMATLNARRVAHSHLDKDAYKTPGSMQN